MPISCREHLNRGKHFYRDPANKKLIINLTYYYTRCTAQNDTFLSRIMQLFSSLLFFFLRSNWSPCIRSDVTRHKKQIRLVDIFTIWRFNGCTSPFFQWPFFNLKSFFGRLDKKRIQKTCSFCNRNVCFGIRTVFLKRCLTPKMTLVLEKKLLGRKKEKWHEN